MPEQFTKSKEQIVFQAHHGIGNFSYHLSSLTALFAFLVPAVQALLLSSQVMRAHCKNLFAYHLPK